jgi:very-short-patch-repair endonuclease
MSPDAIDWQLRSGRWQVLQRGVYSVFTGLPTREATLWAAVRRAGPGAVLSHQTAAELFKLTDRPSAAVHVTIPEYRRVSRPIGVVIHRSSRVGEAVHPALQPLRTRIEETVLDLAELATTFDSAFAVVSASCQRRLTTCDRLLEAMGKRAKLRWRIDLAKALGDIADGVHSVLEYRYVNRVERPHGLPEAVRQVRVGADGQNRYLDNLYRDYHLCVELDGQQAHPDDRRWLDQGRANAITAQGMATLRYGWIEVDRRACEVAAQVAVVLCDRGWPGSQRPCGSGCPVGRPPKRP